MKNMTALEHLKEKAFAISTEIKVMYLHNFEDFFDPKKENYKNNTYDIHNKQVIAFFTDNVLYVIPFTYKAVKILENANFTLHTEDDDMYIPFTDGSYPLDNREKWNSLLKESIEQRSDEFYYDLMEYCDKVNIGSIDTSLFEKCFEIPKEGLMVQFDGSLSTISPVSCDKWSNFAKQLGHYNYNKGTYVFVYRNGKTYVTRSYDVILALKKVGYQPNYDMYVPLSNGEKIMQTKYANQWEKAKAM